MAVNLLTTYISLSVLSPEYIGIFQTFLLIKSYALFSNLGEVESIRKQGAVLWARNESAEFRRYQEQALTVAVLTIAVVVATVSVIGMTTLKPTGIRALTFVAVLVLFGVEYLQYFFGNCLVAQNEFEVRTRGVVLLAVVSLLLLLLILPFGYVGFLISKVIAAIVFLVYLMRVLKFRIRFTRHLTEFRTMVKTGLPMSIVGLLSAYYLTADRLVVVHRLGTFQMGIYSIVPMIAVPLALFVQGTSTVLFTRSSHLLGNRASPKAIVEDVAAFTRTADRFVPHLVCILIFFLPLAVSTLLPKYESGTTAAQIALLGYCFFGLASPSANLFIVLDRTRLYIGILLASGSVTVILGNLGVTAGWGLTGVALGTAVGCFAYSVSTMYFPLLWADYGKREGLVFVARQIRSTLVLMGVASVALLIIRAFGGRSVLLSTIVGALFAIGSAPTVVPILRRAVQHVLGLDSPCEVPETPADSEATALPPDSMPPIEVAGQPTRGLT
jgi:O-antigen/teichoic acid export membrane protein